MAGFTLRDDDEKEMAEGIWTPYGPEPTEEERARNIKQERFKIRPLTQTIIDHFDTIAVNKVWDKQTHQHVDEPDKDRKNELLYDYMIEDWQGVYLDKRKTQQAPCTLENKLKLAGMGLDRPNFIFTQAGLYANDDAAREAAEEANFRRNPPTRIGPSETGLRGVSANVSQGDVEADEYGRTIITGGGPPELFRCELCPQRIIPQPDEITVKANEVYSYLARHPFS